MYEDQESVHVVMELCRGGDLFDLIKQAKRLREVDAAWLFRSEPPPANQVSRSTVAADTWHCRSGSGVFQIHIWRPPGFPFSHFHRFESARAT